MTLWSKFSRMLRRESEDAGSAPSTPRDPDTRLTPRQAEMKRLRQVARQAAKLMWSAPSAEQSEIASYTLRKARQRLRELRADEQHGRETAARIRERPGGYYDPKDGPL